MNTPPVNTDDVIDSCDVIARIEELEAELEEARDDGEDLDAVMDSEYNALKELAKEGEGSPDWPHGGVLIRDTYFKEYAQELAEDCGMVTDGANWPNNCIDWEQAAEVLQQDYMNVEFDGVDYWIRA